MVIGSPEMVHSQGFRGLLIPGLYSFVKGRFLFYFIFSSYVRQDLI